MKTPSWQEVGIPQIMVDHIKQLKPGFAFDSLVHQVVFQNNKKLFVSYNCDICGHKFSPTKTTDEVSNCVSCYSKRVRCIQSLKFNKGTKLPTYSRKGSYLSTLFAQMSENFSNYFKAFPERNLDWEWHGDLYHVAFAGGETATGSMPRTAVAKAALLTPYLWDTTFDWKNLTQNDKVETHFITSLLGHLQTQLRK